MSDIFTQELIPIQLDSQIQSSLKIPESKSTPFIRIGVGSALANLEQIDEKQRSYIGNGAGIAIYEFASLDLEAILNGQVGFELFLPLQTKHRKCRVLSHRTGSKPRSVQLALAQPQPQSQCGRAASRYQGLQPQQ